MSVSSSEGVPTFKELGYSSDIGLMRRVIMAPAGIPEDRLMKLRGAVAELQNNKTYLRLIKAIGENTSYIDGAEYAPLRPEQSEKYKILVKELAGG